MCFDSCQFPVTILNTFLFMYNNSLYYLDIEDVFLSVKNIAVYTLIILLCSSMQFQQIDNTTAKEKTVQALPPTFITLADIPECDERGMFPQKNPLPWWKHASQLQYSCSVYDKDNVAWVMLIFYELWKDEFGDPEENVKSALGRLQITWGKEPLEVENIYSLEGQFIQKARVCGLVKGDYEIWVMSEHHISDTAFVHELVHIALIHTCGSADPDHEGDGFPCWTAEHSMLIEEINSLLYEKYNL